MSGRVVDVLWVLLILGVIVEIVIFIQHRRAVRTRCPALVGPGIQCSKRKAPGRLTCEDHHG